MQIHPVFYIFLLELALTHAIIIIKTEEILPENLKADQKYKIKKILNSKYIDNQFKYLVK